MHHANAFLLLLWQSKKPRNVTDESVDGGSGNGVVGEVEEADVDECMLQLGNEGWPGGRGGKEGIVKDGDTREVCRGGRNEGNGARGGRGLCHLATRCNFGPIEARLIRGNSHRSNFGQTDKRSTGMAFYDDLD